MKPVATTQPVCVLDLHAGILVKSLPTVLPLGTVRLPQRSAAPAAARGFPVNLLLEQLDQDRSTLRVPDEHDAATVAVVGEVVAERSDHAVVGDERMGTGDGPGARARSA